MRRWFPFGLLIASFVVRLGAAAVQPLNLDEGSYLLEATFLKSGFVPFREFAAREPVFTIALAGATYLFGPGYLAGRLLSVLAGAAATWFVYSLGSSMYDHSVGLLAMAVHALTPFFVYGGSILKLEPVASTFAAGAVVLGFRASGSNIWPALLAGLAIGLAVHVRRSSIVLLPLIAYVVWLRSGRLRSTVVTLASGVITVLVPFLLIVVFTNLRWAWIAYGAGQGVLRDIQPTESLLAVLRTAIILLTPHILLALVITLSWLRRRDEGIFVAILLLAVFDLAILLGASLTAQGYGFGVIWTPAWQRAIAVAAVGLCASLIVSNVYSLPRHTAGQTCVSDSILRTWLILLAVFYGAYAAYVHVFVDYLIDFSAVLSLAAARALAFLTANSTRRDACQQTRLTRTFVWGLFFAVPSIYLLPTVNPYNPPVAHGYPEYNLSERTYPPHLVRTTAATIRQQCPRNRELLTADPIFAAVAEYRVFRNLTYPMHYFQNRLAPFDYDPFDLFPDKNRLMFEAAQRQIPCVIAGDRTRTLLVWAPPLQRMLALLYEKTMTLGHPQSIASVDMYKRRSVLIDSRRPAASAIPLSFTPLRGNWNIVPPWYLLEEGHAERALSLSTERILEGVRVSADVVVNGEGGFVIAYMNEQSYFGVRIIDSPHTTGLNVFRATPSGETSLLDFTSRTVIGKPVHLTVYAFPSRLEVQVGGEFSRSLEVALPRDGRIGLLANYGARFTNVVLRRDLRGLLEPPSP